MSTHINPRFRAYGKARLDIARRAHTRQDWEAMWKPTMHPFAFTWGERWKHCIEYRVADFAAEVGFFIDVLGFPVNAFNDGYAMFTSPDEAFHLAVLPADEAHPATPPEAIRLQFMIARLDATVTELQRRGVTFTLSPQPLRPGSRMHIAVFHTPHGIAVELWSEVHPLEQPPRPVLRPQSRSVPRRQIPLAAAPAGPEKAADSPRTTAPEMPRRWPRRVPRKMSAASRKRYREPEDAPSAAALDVPATAQAEPPARFSASEESLRQPSQPVVAVRTRWQTAARRTNRVQMHFLPVPTRTESAEPEEPLPEEPPAPLEPEYEDLPEARYDEDDF